MKPFCQGKYCCIGVLITVPAEDDILDPFFHVIAARSLHIWLSWRKEFWLLFGLEVINIVTLSSAHLLHRKQFFFSLTSLSEGREGKDPLELLFALFLHVGKTFLQLLDFLWSRNTFFCPSLLWVSLAVLKCCVYSSPVKLMLPFLTPTIHATLHL